MESGTIFDIKEFAIHDGPGIRTTVFLKGCPMRCQWCHNPEGLSFAPELMVSKSACNDCGSCRAHCEHQGKCIACGQCIPFCKRQLRRIVGKSVASAELAALLLREKSLVDGFTFSGGEPLAQWPFVSEVIDLLKDTHIAIETSGFAPPQVFHEAMDKCDLILLDWKLSDPDLHRHFTGVDQLPIRRNAEMLCAGETPFILRMPLIPGVNDNEEHFSTVAELVKKSASLIRVEVMPYQLTAGAKYEMVSKKYAPEFDEKRKPAMYLQCFEARKIPFVVL